MDIGDHRREYMSEGIDDSSLDPNPTKQFELWYGQAKEAGIDDANAFSLATATAEGVPSVRTVLLKLFDDQGFVFFTTITIPRYNCTFVDRFRCIWNYQVLINPYNISISFTF